MNAASEIFSGLVVHQGLWKWAVFFSLHRQS
uniref:Uncharacterized protein n=1 Tax=Anguilla anguilla TaxID=7936 RepID=A0A0E9TC77_ANGAN